MTHQEDEAVKEFKEIFLSVTQIMGFITNDEAFKSEHGFSMTEFISLRRSCANKIREVADSIEQVVKDTGIAKTTGGAVAVVSGAATLGGLILAPFTAGASLALTVGGIAGGVASAATTITAAIIKDKKVNGKAEEVKELLDSLKEKDEIVREVIKELQEKIEKIRALYGNKRVMDFVKDSVEIMKWVKQIGYNVVYKGYQVYNSVKAIRLAKFLGDLIKVDLAPAAAVTVSAPGLSLFGKTFVAVGSTSAKVLSGAFSAFGIGFGIWDIVDGAKDINGSQHAEAYRKAADDLDQETNSHEKLLEKIKETVNSDSDEH